MREAPPARTGRSRRGAALAALVAAGACAPAPKPVGPAAAPAPPASAPAPAATPPPPAGSPLPPAVPPGAAAATPSPVPAGAPAPVPPFREVADPRLDVSLATDQAAFGLSYGDWLVRSASGVARVPGPIRVTAGASAPAAPPRFVVQAGSFARREAAEAEAERLSGLLGLPTAVSEAGGRFAVRVGESGERKGAEGLLMRVRRDASPDAFLVGEKTPATDAGTPPSLVVESPTGARSVPSPLEIQAVDGALLPHGESRYRGNLLVRATGRGGVHVVNRVGLEDYLKGVVPGEMGPRVYDELEALKAQAIAARAYALKHRGDFAAEGYDLCATPRCQVYGGASVEQPLSTQAVEETSGEVLLFGDQIADTLFTSTCGGRTEDAPVVFPGYASQPAPYLASVPCFGEEPWTLSTSRQVLLGKGVTSLGLRGLALLAALRREGTAWGDLAEAHAALHRRLGLTPGKPPATLTPEAVYADLAAVPFAEGELLVEPPERAAAPAGWPEKARTAYAVLGRFQLAGATPLPVDRPFRPEEAAGLWASLLLRVGDLEEVDGRIVGASGETITAKTAKGRAGWPLAAGAALFSGGGDRWEPVARLSLRPGDRVKVFVRQGQAVAVAAPVPAASGLYERESSWVHWVRRFTGTELAGKLRERDATRRATVVTALEVLSRGASSRVGRLKVVTDRETVTLTGLEVRFALGLPETLFSVVAGKESGGEPVFTFLGRGWGHGVGLCQNGAFGMALAGKRYRQILAHYYPGTSVGAADALVPALGRGAAGGSR